MALQDEEAVKAYCTLADQLHTQYHQRRELEWRIHVSVWTLIVGVGYLLITQKVQLGRELFLLFFIVPLHFIWCVKIHTGGFRAQYLSKQYRRAAERIINPSGPLIDDKGTVRDPESDLLPPRWLRISFEWYWWWMIAEIGTTILLTTGIVYVLCPRMIQ